MKPLVSLAKVGKTYGERVVFKDVNCDFLPGRFYLVLGANGCGKTTLLKIIAGLTRPSEGEAKIRAGAKIGRLGHATSLYPALAARENLLFWTKLYGRDAARADEALELVGLAARGDDPARSLSRGMAQRLNFARLLVQEPDVWLLDEPFTGLDEKSRELMRGELIKIKNNGACVALVSHNPETDLPLADCLLTIDKRRLLVAENNGDATR